MLIKMYIGKMNIKQIHYEISLWLIEKYCIQDAQLLSKRSQALFEVSIAVAQT